MDEKLFFVLFYHATLYDFDFMANGNLLCYFHYFLLAILSCGVPLFFFCKWLSAF